jgi:AcrR family transcriptional regulator
VKGPGSRQRFIDVAVQLFTQHSFAGTSLQMIADELGVTKAAVYHHFHTREELLTAVVEPLVEELRTVVEEAEALRGRQARAERMLTGFVDIVVRHQGLTAVLSGDPGAIEMLRSHPELSGVIDRQVKLLADVEPGPGGMVKAAVVLAGTARAIGPELLDLDADTLRHHLTEAGRRALGLRTPRRSP